MQESEEEKEFVQRPNSAAHSKVTKEYLENDFDRYVGAKVKRILSKTTKEQMLLFDSFLDTIKGAYFVKGSRKILRRFQAYFVAKCVPKAYSYSTFMLKKFLEERASDNTDELFTAGASKDLLFLYLHREISGIGNTDNWVGMSTVDEAANRSRKGLITVVLSEREFPSIEKSKEFKVIDLGGAEKAREISEVLKKLKNS